LREKTLENFFSKDYGFSKKNRNPTLYEDKMLKKKKCPGFFKQNERKFLEENSIREENLHRKFSEENSYRIFYFLREIF